MKIVYETGLRDFEFWSGAVCRAEQLTTHELDELENALTEIDFCNGEPTDTDINDLMWHDFDYVCELLGLELDEHGDIIRNNLEEVDE